jgi:hypothetical protein
MCKRNIVNPNPPENHYKFWQNEAMRKLGKNYADCTNEELAELMGRTKGAITTRITILRIVVRMAPYAEELLDVITKKKQSNAAKKFEATPQGKERRAKALEKACTPEARAKLSASKKKYYSTPDGIEAHKLLVAKSKSPKALKNRSAAKKAAAATKEGKAKLDKARKAGRSPEALAKRSASMKAAWARKKAEAEKD